MTSQPCSPRSRATCAAVSASATGSCALPRAPRPSTCCASCARAATSVALLIADQRMPGDGRHRVPRRGARARARGQARAADRVRRHRGRDRRDQQGGARLLPAEAVGPARGAALPRDRGPADDVGVGRLARGRRAAHHRPPVLEGVARPARLRRTQPRAGTLARRRARRRGSRAAEGGGRRGRPAARRAARGRLGARAPDGARARRAPRRDQPAHTGALRPRDRRRRTRRARGGRVRRFGGAQDRARRARGARRAGRPVEPHRELPRLPDGTERVGPRAPRDRPGASARRRAPDDPGRGRTAGRRRRTDRRAERRWLAEQQLRARRLGRVLPAVRGAGILRADRRRHLLRRGHDRGALVRRPERRDHRRRELGRPGRRVLQRLRGPGDDARARLGSREVDVAATSSSRSASCRTWSSAPEARRSRPRARTAD